PRTDPYERDSRIRLLPWMFGVEPHVGIRMQDHSAWNPGRDEWSKTLPADPTPLTPTAERAKPVPDDLRAKPVETRAVAGHRVVVEIPLHHTVQPGPDRRHRIMPALVELRLHLLELRPEALLYRFSLHSECARRPWFSVVVRSPQK